MRDQLTHLIQKNFFFTAPHPTLRHFQGAKFFEQQGEN